jgi:hypothetical protein
MSGNNSANAPNSNSYPGVYGTLGVPAAANVPGSRSNAVTWIDARGRLYLFGGSGIDSVGTGGNLNDLWRFDPATREWAWMSGSKTTPWGENGNTGVYGTFGIPSAGNHPGGRHYANSWTDTNGNFWLFGGLGSAADIVLISGSEAGDMLNDLWEYQPTDAPSPAAAPLFSVTAGTYASTQTVTLSDVMPSAAIFYTLDGTTPTAGSTPYTTALTIADTTTVKSIAIAGNFADSSIASATYTIHLPQAITFTPLPSPVTYGVKAATLSATSTSGLGVSFSLVSGPAKVISSRLYIQGAGTVVVAANQSGGPHYSAAPQVTQTITVHQATLTVSANNRSMTYGGAVPALTYAMTGFVDDDNAYWATSGAPSLSTTVLSSSPAGAYAIAIQAGSLSAANYTFKFDPGTLTVKTATLTISANNRSMTYGAIVPALTYSIGGFVNGDTQATAAKGAPTLETTATSSSPVGSYPISIAAGTLTSSNYSFRFFSGTLTLDKARLTVSANNLTMVQGAAVPALTYSMTGFVNHETQSKATTGQPALSTAATSKSTPATYPIAVKPGTLAAGNYVFSFANGTLTVTK